MSWHSWAFPARHSLSASGFLLCSLFCSKLKELPEKIILLAYGSCYCCRKLPHKAIWKCIKGIKKSSNVHCRICARDPQHLQDARSTMGPKSQKHKSRHSGWPGSKVKFWDQCSTISCTETDCRTEPCPLKRCTFMGKTCFLISSFRKNIQSMLRLTEFQVCRICS